MIIKKFQANTETEAIMLAKEKLGKDAIVMNIKTIKPKGIYKFFRKVSVEVTAAIDENVNYSKEKKTFEEKVERPKRNPNIIYDDDLVADGKAADKGTAGDVSSIEMRLNNLQTMIERQMSEGDGRKGTDDRHADPVESGEGKNIDCVKLIYNQMIENEVDEKYANQVINEIEGKLRNDSPVDQILSGIYQKIVLKLGQTRTLEVNQGEGKFVFFVGSTGVGKTTTIAKLASNLKLKMRYKVAILAADTYRIAAVEQLRTYANIIDVPLRVIYSEEEMSDIMEELGNYDVIMVDTAGRSHRNKGQKDDLERLIKKVPMDKREVYLVLSATTKYKDLVEITKSYADIDEYRLLFTKLDETNAVGNIFNIKLLTGAPLSYATFGQNVPDDIGRIDPQNIAKHLMGGND